MSTFAAKLKRKDAVRKRIPNSLKNALIGVLTSSLVGGCLRLVYRNKIPHRNGIRIRTDSPRISSSAPGAIYFGIYERAEIDQVMTYCNFALPVVELGASIGVGTLQILNRAKAKVVAVEADPAIHKLMRANVDLNNLNSENFYSVNALIDYSGAEQAQWMVGEDTLRGKAAKNDKAKNELIPCTTLSKLLDDYNIAEYNLVVDIEGAEAELFNVDAQALARCHLIMAEIDGGLHQDHFYSIRELLEVLAGYGFAVIHEHGNRITLKNTAF